MANKSNGDGVLGLLLIVGVIFYVINSMSTRVAEEKAAALLGASAKSLKENSPFASNNEVAFEPKFIRDIMGGIAGGFEVTVRIRDMSLASSVGYTSPELLALRFKSGDLGKAIKPGDAYWIGKQPENNFDQARDNGYAVSIDKVTQFYEALKRMKLGTSAKSVSNNSPQPSP